MIAPANGTALVTLPKGVSFVYCCPGLRVTAQLQKDYYYRTCLVSDRSSLYRMHLVFGERMGRSCDRSSPGVRLASWLTLCSKFVFSYVCFGSVQSATA